MFMQNKQNKQKQNNLHPNTVTLTYVCYEQPSSILIRDDNYMSEVHNNTLAMLALAPNI